MKLFLKIFVGILVALFIVAAALPTILSMESVQPSMIGQINGTIPGHIEIKNYSLSWFGGVKIEGFQLKDPNGDLVVDFEKFETHTPLYKILLNKTVDANTQIQSLNARIVKNPSGKTNLEESLGSEKLFNLLSPLFLSNVDLKFAPQENQTFAFLLTGKTIQDNQKGDFVIDLLFNDDDLHAKVNITKFPVSVLEAFMTAGNPEFSGVLSAVFGDYVNLSIHELSLDDSNLYQIKANSIVATPSNAKPVIWNLAATFEKPDTIDDLSNLWMGIKDFHLQCENIPTALLDENTSKKDHFQNTLGNFVTVSMKGSGEDPQSLVLSLASDKVDIPEIAVWIKEPIAFDQDLTMKHLSGTLSIPKLAFPQESPATTLSNLKIDWDVDGAKRNIQTILSGKMSDNGELTGKVDYHEKNSRIFANLQGQKIPAHFFELISGTDFFNPLFGQSIETEVEVDVENMNGPINVQLKGSNGRMALKGKIDQGTLTLSEPFYIETQPTQKLGQNLLKQYSPILGELQTGNSKISLFIDHDGFSAPVFDFSLEKIKIKQGKVELGKLVFNNKGEIKKAVRFLNGPSTDKVSIWFTPQYFAMEKGFLKLDRTDLLLMDIYPIAVWGNIDFAKNYVDAIVAISGTALEQAFGVKGMRSNDFLQLPLKGKIEKVKIDSGLASTRIASLVAKQQGPEGLLLGTMLDIAQGSSKEQTPPPTTDPLPWAGQLKSANNESKSSSKKQLEGAAKEILKGILSK